MQPVWRTKLWVPAGRLSFADAPRPAGEVASTCPLSPDGLLLVDAPRTIGAGSQLRPLAAAAALSAVCGSLDSSPADALLAGMGVSRLAEAMAGPGGRPREQRRSWRKWTCCCGPSRTS